MMMMLIITIINVFKFVAFYTDLSLCIARNNAGVLQVNLAKKNISLALSISLQQWKIHLTCCLLTNRKCMEILCLVT